MNEAFTYDDVNLIPNYSELSSRSLADTMVELCGWKFKLPIVPANMRDVIDINLAKYLSENGYFYIYHRFGDKIDHPLNFVRQANEEKWKLISISVGVNVKDKDFIDCLLWEQHRVDFITIDVAHAHHSKVKSMVEFIKKNFPTAKLIVGNIATYKAYSDLCQWGADVVKVGIGQGSICTTRFQTGFSMPMFSCVKLIVNNDTVRMIPMGQKRKLNIPIIADGGVKYYGDIAKALVAGATMVMSGKLFASCIDSPAEIVDNKKQYRGSTSFAVKKQNNHIEGKTIDLEANVKVSERLNEITQALQSAISYAGGEDLSAFKNVEYCIVNNN